MAYVTIQRMCVSKQRNIFSLCTAIVLFLLLAYIITESGFKWNVTLHFENYVKRMKVPIFKYQNFIEQDTWQPVDSNGKAFVFSAFYESNFKDRVRVIGAVSIVTRLRLWCVFWFRAGSTGTIEAYRVTGAHVEIINEGHGTKYSAAYFVCEKASSDIPEIVSITEENPNQPPSNYVYVHDRTTTEARYNFSACICPMFSTQYPEPNNLIEWIEMNRLLGVQHFTFYVFSVSESVRKVLNYYKRNNHAEIIDWTFVLFEYNAVLFLSDDIHYYGQLAALNDCLYRHKGRSKYLVTIDLDELIIPHMNNAISFDDIIMKLPDNAVYMFRHSYFKRNCVDNLCLIYSYNKTENILPAFERSKLISKPDEVITLGIHNAWATVPDKQYYIVETDIALLHHYRETWNDNKFPYITDNTTMKYKELIRQRHQKMVDEILQH